MNYQQSVEWVHSLPRLSKTTGIENTQKLLALVGNPEDKLKFVHIAGTNGKGSTTVMLASILKEAGYKTGATISPFVIDFCERFQINGEMIEQSKLAEILTEIKIHVDTLKEQDIQVVEFDVVTVASFLYFAMENCDIVCAEVGLGGRLDSTNAIKNTLVACITAIGKDHIELLGDTFQKIAKEKCGIFKNNCTAVMYPVQPQEAQSEIEMQANVNKCKLIKPELEDLYCYKGMPFENRINYGGYDLQVPFPGMHQACNTMVVIETALALCEKGFEIDDEHIINGIANAKFPARIEVISRNPLVIVDGAHNVDGAIALAQTLKLANVKKITAVMGVLHGKNAKKVIETISPYIDVLYTITANSPRAIEAEELADMAREFVSYTCPCDTIEDAIELAKEEENGVLVCGSLYLASDARKILLEY